VVDVDLPADPEGDHTGEADRGPQNRSQGVDMSDPAGEQAEGDTIVDAEIVWSEYPGLVRRRRWPP
jgi:hypothetical protein